MTIPDEGHGFCLIRPGMNPLVEPCRYNAAHLGPHSWDPTLKSAEAAARAKAARVTLTKAELMQVIGDAACRKLGRMGSNQVIAKFEYAPDGELTSVDVELIPRPTTESPREDPSAPRVE